MIDVGVGLQSLVNTLAKFFGVFREILSAFPFPILDFFGVVISLFLAFAIAKIIIGFI